MNDFTYYYWNKFVELTVDPSSSWTICSLAPFSLFDLASLKVFPCFFDPFDFLFLPFLGDFGFFFDFFGFFFVGLDEGLGLDWELKEQYCVRISDEFMMS